ncbi:MAG TPA: glycoside hydrolase domain-containing protein [Thermoanaerobaculia bacterium]|nr:glycoside hydrolase domain-containing protein [Thermoanaerobaculia bacterium]
MGDINSGVDSSSVITPSAAHCLAQLGFTFAARYYRSHKSKLNRLTREEALTISAAGLTIVAVFEYAGTKASYFTAEQASMDVKDALEQVAEVGQPLGSAIYFAVDYNATIDDIEGPVNDYFTVINAALRPKYLPGVYGSGATCAAMLAAGLADFAWLSQSVAFLGTPGFTNWSIKQGQPHQFCGLDTDPDDAHGLYGGFTTAVP